MRIADTAAGSKLVEAVVAPLQIGRDLLTVLIGLVVTA